MDPERVRRASVPLRVPLRERDELVQLFEPLVLGRVLLCGNLFDFLSARAETKRFGLELSGLTVARITHGLLVVLVGIEYQYSVVRAAGIHCRRAQRPHADIIVIVIGHAGSNNDVLIECFVVRILGDKGLHIKQ
jgi:hypothetical protein